MISDSLLAVACTNVGTFLVWSSHVHVMCVSSCRSLLPEDIPARLFWGAATSVTRDRNNSHNFTFLRVVNSFVMENACIVMLCVLIIQISGVYDARYKCW